MRAGFQPPPTLLCSEQPAWLYMVALSQLNVTSSIFSSQRGVCWSGRGKRILIAARKRQIPGGSGATSSCGHVLRLWRVSGDFTVRTTFPGLGNPIFEVKTVLWDGAAAQSAHNPARKPDSKQFWICSFGCFTGISKNLLLSSEKEGRPMVLVSPCLLLSFGLWLGHLSSRVLTHLCFQI